MLPHQGTGDEGSALNPGTKGPGTKGSSIANALIQNPALDEALADGTKQVYKIIDVTWEVTTAGPMRRRFSISSTSRTQRPSTRITCSTS